MSEAKARDSKEQDSKDIQDPVQHQMEEALKSIIDPELYIDIWTLGLIYEVRHENKEAKVRMTFTSVACPAGPQLVDQVRNKILAVEGIEDISVEVVFDPPWEPSEELKALMGMA